MAIILEIKKQLQKEGWKESDITSEVICDRLNKLGIPFVGYHG
ncbi:hypothetical protein [Halalkalibacter nanhaiisediminis]|nr:hypothetical protein [Halalkalibacter nanhaiisediminis]